MKARQFDFSTANMQDLSTFRQNQSDQLMHPRDLRCTTHIDHHHQKFMML